MKNKQQKPDDTQTGGIILSTEDYHLLCDMLKHREKVPGEATDQLAQELKRARLVDGHALPPDVVRVNSRVTIREVHGKDAIDLQLVLPSESDIRSKRISVFAPVGTALLGFRKGDQVNWRVPAGVKTFIIEEVVNN